MLSPLIIKENSYCKFEPQKHNDYKQRRSSYLQQGVLVNNFVNTNNVENATQSNNFEQILSLPDEFCKKPDKKSSFISKILNNPVAPLIAIPVCLLGGGAALSRAYKKAILTQNTSSLKNKLPSTGRVITMNDDNTMVLYLLLQDPNPKAFLAAAGVFAASSTAFIMKNIVDGFKAIWINKKEADIEINKEKALIDIETKSFAGKYKILNNILGESSKKLNQIENSLNFKGMRQKQDIKDNKNTSDKSWLYPLFGSAALLASGLLASVMFKNFKSTAKNIENIEKKALGVLEPRLKDFKSKQDLENELAKLDNVLSKQNKNLIINKSGLPQSEKDQLLKDLEKNSSQGVYSEAPPVLGGWVNKIGFTSFVQDKTAFLYNWIVNPTPQTKTLLYLIASTASFGYIGKSTVEALKEVQVKKANAQTEIDLRDRLVKVELENFSAKKQAFVKPLIEKYKVYSSQNKSGKSEEQAQALKNDILSEIKNGPPFIYS